MTTGIYKITNPKGRIYIGKANWIERRWSEHRNDRFVSAGPKLTNSFRKYGKQNHKFEIIEECSKDIILERERYYQELFDTVENGLNHMYTATTDNPGGILVNCNGCGKSLSRSKSHIKKTNWCSRECFNTSRRVETNCKNCGKEFSHHLNETRNHCSRTCYFEWQKGRPIGGR